MTGNLPKLKVCFFINSLMAGGAERVMSTFCNHLYNDYEIHLVLLDGGIEFNLPPSIKIKSFDQSNNENIILKYLKLFTLAFKYKRYCKKNKIDVSFSFLTRANYINILSKYYGAKYKVIISERTYASEYFAKLSKLQSKIGIFLTTHIYKKTDFLTTNSKRSLNNLQKDFGISKPASAVIENPLDITNIQLLAKEKPTFTFIENIFYFIHVGRLRIEKNHTLLINAFAQIAKNNEDVNILLVGEGPEEENIRVLIETLGLQDKIILVGNQKNPYAYMARANCLVLSSDFEGLPNVLLEALACNLPIISTDCNSGPREILAPNSDSNFCVVSTIEMAEYGILIPVKDEELLIAAMQFAIKNPTWLQRQKEILYKRANDFSIEKIIDKVKIIINNF